VPARWFRIAYARNAFLRHLAAQGIELDDLTAARAAEAMVRFQRDHRPQHGELDELTASWGPVGDDWGLVFERRMTRHDHPERRLRLVLRFAPRADDPIGCAGIASVSDARSVAGVRSARGRTRRGVSLDDVTVDDRAESVGGRATDSPTSD
jgi:hypothetical protein